VWEEGKRRRRGGKIWSRGNEEVEEKRERKRGRKKEREGVKEGGGEEREKRNVSIISSESSSPKTAVVAWPTV
jgi:hypothetical protein